MNEEREAKKKHLVEEYANKSAQLGEKVYLMGVLQEQADGLKAEMRKLQAEHKEIIESEEKKDAAIPTLHQ